MVNYKQTVNIHPYFSDRLPESTLIIFALAHSQVYSLMIVIIKFEPIDSDIMGVATFGVTSK